MQLAEAGAVFALGDDRDIEGVKGLPLHRRADNANRFVFMPVIHLEKQLIVNLQNRADIRLVRELSDQLRHRQLQDLRCSALNRCVHAAAFGKAALAPVGAIIDVREIAPSAEGRLAVPVESSRSDRLFLPFGQARITGFQAGDDTGALILGLFEPCLELERPLQAAREQAVEGAEVHVLCDRPTLFVIGVFLVLCLIDADPEDDRCGAGVDVAAAAVRFHHARVAAVERADAQLDLREVEIEEGRALRRNHELPDTDRVGALPGHVLQIRPAGGEAPRVGSHRHEVGVNPACRRVDPFEVSVDVGALDLCPLAEFLHSIEELDELRAVLFAVGAKQLDRFIVRRLGIFGRGLQDGQVFRLIQIILERLRPAVFSDVHVSDDRLQLCPQIHEVRLGLRLLLSHELGIEEDTAVLHHAGENGGRAFDPFADLAVLRDVVLKPVVESVIELQCPVAIRAGVPAGIPCVRVELVEAAFADHFLELREFHAVEVRHEGLEAAVAEVEELEIVFQGELRCDDRVIDRFLQHDPVLIEEHCLERHIVRDLDRVRVLEHALPQVCHDGRDVRVLADAMAERDIPAGAFFDRNRHAGDVRLMCVQSGLIIVSVCVGGRCLKVEGHHARAADVVFNVRNAADRLIIIHSLYL